MDLMRKIVRRAVAGALWRRRPEFLNRVDELIMFRPLSQRNALGPNIQLRGIDPLGEQTRLRSPYRSASELVSAFQP
jgi:hypothetical protein